MKIRHVLCFFLLVISGCMTERVQPATEYPSVPRQSVSFVKKIEYDEHGRPLFHETLKRRPGKAGEMCTIVHFVNNRPVRSFDVVVEQQKADLGKPLAVIYQWTGRGFEAGLNITGNLSQVHFQGSGKEAGAYLAFITAPIVIGGVTGFVFGIVSSIPETATELRHLVVNAPGTVTGYAV